MTSIRGRHQLKFGLDLPLIRYANYQPIGTGGIFTFDRAFTRSNYLTQDSLSGNAVASLLLGAPILWSGGSIWWPYYQWKYYAPWIQDDIKLTRRLTINLGLRWDITSPVTEKYDRVNRGFFADQVNPISSKIDQTQFPGYKVYGGIGFAGENGQSRSPFNSGLEQLAAAHRRCVPADADNGPSRRLGHLLHQQRVDRKLASASARARRSSPYDAGRTAANLISNPFPSGIQPPSGSASAWRLSLGRSPTFSGCLRHSGIRAQLLVRHSEATARQISVEAAYVGSRTIGVPTTMGFNEMPADKLALGDVTQGGNPNYLNEQVPNPFENCFPAAASTAPPCRASNCCGRFRNSPASTAWTFRMAKSGTTRCRSRSTSVTRTD